MTARPGPRDADPEFELLLRAARGTLAGTARLARASHQLSTAPTYAPESARPTSVGRPRQGEPAPGLAAKPARGEASAIDLQRLFRLAQRHRLVPHLCRELLRPGTALGDETRAQVALAQQRTARRAAAQAAELTRLVEACAERGIDLLALKGPELAVELFGDAALRWSRDLDLLVRQREVAAAAEALVELGYEHDLPAGFRFESRLGRAWIAHGAGQLELRHAESKLLVELHWKLAHPRVELPLPEELLFSGTREIRLDGGFVQTLARQPLVVYLCHHGSRHRWLRLHWLLDVAALTRLYGADDWRRAAELADDAGVGPAVGLAVVLAERLLAVPVPSAIAERGSWLQRGRRLADEVLPAILEPTTRGVRFDGVAARQRWGLMLQTRWRNRLQPGFWLWPLALARNDLDWPGFPDALTPLLYLARPVRSAARRIGSGRDAVL